MPSRSLTRTINRTTVATLATALAVGGWGWFVSGQLAMQSSDAAFKNARRTSNDETTKPSSPHNSTNDPTPIDSKLWTRSLQSGFRAKPIAPFVERMVPVIPAPPTPRIVPVVPSTEIGLRLVGTVIEKGGSMAIAIDRLGKLDFCREGASLQLLPEGIRIESVSEETVRVSFQGQSANWSMGQPLRFDKGLDGGIDRGPGGVSEGGVPVDAIPASPAGNTLRSKPKMSTEEELERINGSNPSVPL